ncbi:guanylate kinase [Desulfoplanes formicivorans]|uniref:Guanylate kinase n=1 Tax=Desulfoplanes formicivorans TaxID=1592317 RepID=A0A194ADV0_9BACT|nr:guanylate kinase [Desulfoplanes formicivorans]GAU07513.1 guanylate kinase [Desulfoplanes formicivorans]
MIERTGLPLVISAPSGTGKSTLIARLRQEFPAFAFSISCTTRAPRPGEIHGKDYYFLDKKTFLQRRDNHFFAEWASVHGNLYGTPLEATQTILAQGKDIIFDIDVQGARQLKQTLPQSCFVFLFPPSLKALESRLVKRGTDSREVIAKRLANARDEINQCDLFEFWIINDDLDTAYEELRAVYLAARARAIHRPGLKQTLLAT